MVHFPPQLSNREHKVPRRNESTDVVGSEETGVQQQCIFFFLEHRCRLFTVRLLPGPENDALEACQGITAAKKNVLSALIYH